MLFVVIRLNEKIMRVLVQSALVGAPKKHDQNYTDSHAGSRRISSIFQKHHADATAAPLTSMLEDTF
jgi:hypothetical protein